MKYSHEACDGCGMMMMVRWLDGIVLMEIMVVRGRWAFDFWYPPLRNLRLIMMDREARNGTELVL